MFLLAGDSLLRLLDREDLPVRAVNYQAIQEEKKGGEGKKKTEEKTKNLDSSFVIYEVRRDGRIKFARIL